MSSDSAKVRLVRCPKCENLLPELADFPFYQCGGCGAVLRGSRGSIDGDNLSEKSDEEGVGVLYAKFADVTEKGGLGRPDELIKTFNDASDKSAKSNGSSLKVESKEALSTGEGGGPVTPLQQQQELPKVFVNQGVVEDSLDTISNRLGGLKDSKPQIGNTSKSVRSTGIPNWRNGERSGMDGFLRNPGNEVESVRLTGIPNWRNGETSGMDGFLRNPGNEVEGVRTFVPNNGEEGPSSYIPHSVYGSGYGAAFRDRNDDNDGPQKVAYLEHDRAELLRKLEELKDQLSRSCNVSDRTKEKVPLEQDMLRHESHGNSDAWLSESSSTSNRALNQMFMPGNHLSRPPYYAHYPEPYYHERREMAMLNGYPSSHIQEEMPRFGDYFGSHLPRKAPHQMPVQYQHQTSHPYAHGLYDADPDSFQPYPFNTLHHQSNCSCFQCFNQHRQVIQSINSDHPRFADASKNPNFYHPDNPNPLAPRLHNYKISNPPPLSSNDPRSRTRWPNDLNSEVDGFLHRPLKRVVLANSARRCHPIAGAAPFVTCHNCFELLQLPRKALTMDKNRQKVRCGACSTVICYVVVDSKFVVSADEELTATPQADIDCSNEAGNGQRMQSHPSVTMASAKFFSDDFDSSGCEFQSIDRGTALSIRDANTGSNKTRDAQSLQSSTPSDTEDEDLQNGALTRKDAAFAVDTPKKPILTRPPAGSPLQEHFDYSSNNHAANRFAKGNQSSRSDHEKLMPKAVTSRQNSLKRASMATEMEVSFNEFSNTGTSQDSMDASGEEDRRRTSNRGGISAGIIKKSFRDFGRPNQAVENVKINVTVNDQPIPDHLLKKAEKLAGPICPGHYWYDNRAGFWGAMGGPCRGIIPPFIEEFNYPMAEDCAGGTTGVFVNGRELHQKDLDLLASRGLSTVRDRSYIVEISGRVLDEDTGEELDCLGRLAPTVEKAKHGFGMKVPRSVAA